jgi:hypothetical protein
MYGVLQILMKGSKPYRDFAEDRFYRQPGREYPGVIRKLVEDGPHRREMEITDQKSRHPISSASSNEPTP